MEKEFECNFCNWMGNKNLLKKNNHCPNCSSPNIKEVLNNNIPLFNNKECRKECNCAYIENIKTGNETKNFICLKSKEKPNPNP